MTATTFPASQGSLTFHRLTVEQSLRADSNCFTLIRLLASIAVIYGHAYTLSPSSSLSDPVERLLHFDYSGSLAVKLFFFVSGMMMVASLASDPRLPIFLLKRGLRIFPALSVCILTIVFIIGPLFTDHTVVNYFTSWGTWQYLVGNISLYDVRWQLPGLFTNSPYGPNGSIWTLPFEVVCYLLLALVGAERWLKSRRNAAWFCVAIIAASILVPERMPWFGLMPEARLLPACFATGVLFGLYRREIVIDWGNAFVLYILVAVLAASGYGQYPFYLAFFYTVLCLATTPALVQRARLSADVSYGVYLFGFPIQQILYHLMPSMSVLASQAATIFLATAVGALSWALVEKRAIAFGKAIARGGTVLHDKPIAARLMLRRKGPAYVVGTRIAPAACQTLLQPVPKLASAD